jgi:hypothetical protein
VKQRIKKVLLRAAKKTINNLFNKISRLYEQGADCLRIGKYIQQWCKWLNAGLGPEAQNFMYYQTVTLKDPIIYFNLTG